MAAAPQLLADGTGLPLGLRQQGVQQGRFANTGVAAEGAEPPADPLPDLVQPFPAVVADGNEGQSGSFIGAAQELHLAEVSLGADDDGLHPLVHGNGRELVQHQRAGGGLGGAGHKEQHIQIGHRRPDKHVFAGCDLGND